MLNRVIFGWIVLIKCFLMVFYSDERIPDIKTRAILPVYKE